MAHVAFMPDDTFESSDDREPPRLQVELRQKVYVNAPVRDLLAFFSLPEDLPWFVDHVREVVPDADDARRWHWTVPNPAGAPLTWETEVTEHLSGRFICWKSLAGEAPVNTGTMRWESEGEGTRLSLEICYDVPRGAAGEALIRALGSDPEQRLTECLQRFKSLLEARRASVPSDPAWSKPPLLH